MSRLLTVLVVVLFAGCASSGSGKNPSSAHDSDLSTAFKGSGDEDSASDSDSKSDAKSDAKSDDGSVDADDVSYSKKQQLPPGPACLDQSGSVQECMSDTDCCKNFYCGIDPTGSPRQKVCLYGGK